MKKEIKHKKLIIILASACGAILILASVLLGLFCPRRIGLYFNIKADKVDSVYAIDEITEDGEKKVYLEKERTKEFIKELKKVKVAPKYGPDCKCLASYHFYVTCGDTVYEIDSKDLVKRKDGKKKKAYRINPDYDNNLYKLLKYFDM